MPKPKNPETVDEETSPEVPGEEEYTEPQGQEAESETQPPSEEGQGEPSGELIGGKFKSQDELLRAYQELESSSTRDKQRIREHEQIISRMRMGPPPGAMPPRMAPSPPSQDQEFDFYSNPIDHTRQIVRGEIEAREQERKTREMQNQVIDFQRNNPEEFVRIERYMPAVLRLHGPELEYDPDPVGAYIKKCQEYADRDEERHYVQMLRRQGMTEEAAKERVRQDQQNRASVSGLGGGAPPKPPKKKTPQDEAEENLRAMEKVW